MALWYEGELGQICIEWINIEKQRILQIATSLNCKADSMPITYLGFPLGGNPKHPDFWNSIQEKSQ